MVKAKRRRLAASLATTLLILLLLMGVGIATNQWGVLDYLFGGIQNADQKTLEKVWAVGQSKTALGVTGMIDSVMYDGKRIAVGWVFENTIPYEPVYFVLNSLTVDDQTILVSTSNNMENSWLPDPFTRKVHPESITKGGFVGTIKGDVPEGEIDVVIRVSLFKPTHPLYILNDNDFQNASAQFDTKRKNQFIWEKSRQGYLVVNDAGDVQLTLPAEEDTEDVYVGGSPDEVESIGKFKREDMEFTFSLSAKDAEAGRVDLVLDNVYRFDGFTAHYTKATLTPLTTNLVAEITPEDGTYESALSLFNSLELSLTDGLGNELEFNDEDYISGGKSILNKDGIWYVKADYDAMPALKQMPPVISITMTKGSKHMIMPLYIP